MGLYRGEWAGKHIMSVTWDPGDRPGKSCKLSSSEKFRISQCPQNSVIRDKVQRESSVLNVGVAWWNPHILITYPQSIALQPRFWIINAPFDILLPQISFIHPQFSIVNSDSSVLTQKCRIFDSKCPQNSLILNEMSTSAACTACSFFQVCLRGK